MSFEDAASALEGAIAADAGETPVTPVAPVEQATPAPTTPEGQTTPAQVQPTQPRDEFGRITTPEQTPAQTDTFDGGQFNPDTLPPELQPGWKQLQAAYTRKTQELAQQRAQFDGLGDPETVRTAVELYTALQDPQYLTQFHKELTDALQAQGLSPVQASAEAARQIEAAVAPEGTATSATPDIARLKEEYPELAPFLDQTTALQQRLDSFEQAQRERQEAEALAYTQMAVAGELQRQENILISQHPEWNVPDPETGERAIDHIYELSSYHDGNLLTAAQRYEQIINGAVGRYVQGKASVAETSGLTPPRGVAGTSEQPTAPQTLDEGLKAALAHLAQAGIDTIG